MKLKEQKLYSLCRAEMTEDHKLIQGDCLDVLREMPDDNSDVFGGFFRTR